MTPLKSTMLIRLAKGQNAVNDFLRKNNLKKEAEDRELDKKINECFRENPTFLSSGLKASPAKAQELRQKLQNLAKIENSELHAIWVACCVELHALMIFKTFYSGLKEASKEWKSLPPPKKVVMLTSEGMAFYFRFMANSKESEIDLNLRKGNRKRLIERALTSSNSEIKKFAKSVLTLQKRTSLINRTCELSQPVLSFLATFEDHIKPNDRLKNSCSYFSSFIKALNYTNDFVKRELGKTLHETSWTLDENQNIYQKIEQILSSLEQETKERSKNFFTIEKVLQERRKRQKNKFEFTKKYLKHNLENLPIQSYNYKDIHQKYFASLTEAKRKPSKISPPKKAKIRKPIKVVPKPIPSPKISPETKVKPSIVKAENQKHIQVAEKIKALSPQFSYAWRVAEWFQEAPKHLLKDTYANLSRDEQSKQVAYHAFPQEIENYIHSHGYEKTYFNPKTHHQDKLYCIAGEIHFGRMIERGIYSFCIGKDGALYHRYFTKKADELMYQFAQNIFYEIDYPPLSKSVSKKQSSKFLAPSSPHPTAIDELTGAVILHDVRDPSVKYVLFQSHG